MVIRLALDEDLGKLADFLTSLEGCILFWS